MKFSTAFRRSAA